MKLDKRDTRLRRAMRGRVQDQGAGVRCACRCTARRSTSMRRSSTPEGDKVLVAASTLQKEVRGELEDTGNIEAAKAVGRAIAERAKAKGIGKVAFDRSGFMYHGRVKALADAAREAGLEF